MEGAGGLDLDSGLDNAAATPAGAASCSSTMTKDRAVGVEGSDASRRERREGERPTKRAKMDVEEERMWVMDVHDSDGGFFSYFGFLGWRM